MNIPHFYTTPSTLDQVGYLTTNSNSRYWLGRDLAYRHLYPLVSEREFHACIAVFPRTAKSVVTVATMSVLAADSVRRYPFRDQYARARHTVSVLKSVNQMRCAWNMSPIGVFNGVYAAPICA